MRLPWRARPPVGAWNSVIESPGVYRLNDGDGQTYFVGNSEALRQRARAYARSALVTTRPTRFVAVLTAGVYADAVAITPARTVQMPDPMDEGIFWQLIESCRESLNFPDALRRALRRTDAATVAAFAARWEILHLSLYGWPLWGVAYAMNGGCSDDTFEHVRDWLITQGQRVVDAARADPVAWSLSLARKSSGLTFSDMDGELASYVAPELHEELTGWPVLCAKPLVGGKPFGVRISEDTMLELYAEVACAWGDRDTR